VVELAGELDLETVAPASQVLWTAMEQSCHLLVDMSQVTFIGSTGLSLLLRARAELVARSGSLRVRNPSPPVLRLLQLTDLAELLLLDVHVAAVGRLAEPTATR